MIQGTEDLSDMFSVFHDGEIKSARLHGSDLALNVEIGYLAARIDPTYRSFQIVLSGVKDIEFETWPNDAAEQPTKLTNPTEIFQPELGILSGEVADDKVKVICNQFEPSFGYCGGVLSFGIVSATVIDQGGKSYLLQELLQMSAGYWSDWKKANARE